MRCINILKFNRLGRMPKLVLAAGALALALVAGGGATARRADAATGTYTLELSFEYLRFSDINDGFANNRAELYGTINASTDTMGGGRYERMFGTWKNPGICGAEWIGGAGQCYKRVDEQLTYFFSQTPLCATDNLGNGYDINCVAPYATNNNKMRFTVTADPANTTSFVTFYAEANLWDYDSGADDRMWYGGTAVKVFASQIPTLNQAYSLQPYATSIYPQDGKGTVVIRIRRV